MIDTFTDAHRWTHISSAAVSDHVTNNTHISNASFEAKMRRQKQWERVCVCWGFSSSPLWTCWPVDNICSCPNSHYKAKKKKYSMSSLFLQPLFKHLLNTYTALFRSWPATARICWALSGWRIKSLAQRHLWHTAEKNIHFPHSCFPSWDPQAPLCHYKASTATIKILHFSVNIIFPGVLLQTEIGTGHFIIGLVTHKLHIYWIHLHWALTQVFRHTKILICIHFSTAFLIWGFRELDHIPACMGQVSRYTLDRLHIYLYISFHFYWPHGKHNTHHVMFSTVHV